MNILAISKALLVPFVVMVIIMLMSPAIQLNLSTKKNKYLGLIFPAIVFAFFLIVSLVGKPPIVLAIIMTIGAPTALIAFHIIIRNNLRY